MTEFDPVDIACGDLPPDQRARALERLRTDDRLRREVGELRPVVAALRDAPDEVWSPPPAGAPPVVPEHYPAPAAAAPDRRAWWRVPRVSPLVAAAACAVAAVAGFGFGGLRDRPVPPRAGAPHSVATIRLSPVAAGGHAAGEAHMLNDGRLEVDARGLGASPKGSVYTVWLLNKDMTMEPVGSFRVAGGGETVVRMPMPYTPGDFDFLDISREADDGNPAHSGHSVLRGPTA